MIAARGPDCVVAMYFAMGARSGMENLRAAGALDDEQEPQISRAVRSWIFTGLSALRVLTSDGDDERRDDAAWDVLAHIGANVTFDIADDPLEDLLPAATNEAVCATGTILGLTAETQADLTDAAAPAVVQYLHAFNDMLDGDQAAAAKVQFGMALIPDDWDLPELIACGDPLRPYLHALDAGR